ncbi:MAG: hypothetical protein HZA52_19400 [Planctomycetes bacterium]|nr:hypothetical protein [Planctomycetota bacterium]
MSIVHVEAAPGTDERLHAAATLDAGRNRGLLVGIQFYPDRTDASFGVLNVSSVDEGTCVTCCRGSTSCIPIELGSRFSSERPNRRASRE